MLVFSAYGQALQLHQKFQLNAHSLQYHTGCSHTVATKITTQCSSCAPFHTCPPIGVNPRGLLPNEFWQMGVTHVPTFGQLKFIHTLVDTYSGVIFATLHRGEKLKDGTSHRLCLFGSTKEIKNR